jgi:hypothetical protein
MDLHTRLERFGGPIDAASTQDISADLDRGRRAVRRRRTVQAIAGSAFGLAAITTAFALTVGGPASDTVPNRAPAVARAPAGRLTLVDYRGPQSPGFTIDKVPNGFFIQNYDGSDVLIAPSPNPREGSLVLTGKIGIYLEAKAFHRNPSGEELTVTGHPAVLHTVGSTRQLLIDISPLMYAIIQVDLPLDRGQILELGAGLHVHQNAIAKYEKDAREAGIK